MQEITPLTWDMFRLQMIHMDLNLVEWMTNLKYPSRTLSLGVKSNKITDYYMAVE